MFRYVLVTAAIAACACSVHAQNSFTYQGTLEDAGAPANGAYDMFFSLWADATVGAPDTQIGSVFTSSATTVTDGLFSVNLNLGDAAFQSQDPLYLQIEVRLNGDTTFTTLTPRQQIVHTPRAIHAEHAASIELPFVGSGLSIVPNGAVFNMTNFDVSGSAVSVNAPTWGLVGFAGDFAPSLSVPTPSGIFGLGERVGTAGSSTQGSGIYGTSGNGIGGEFAINSNNAGNALEAYTSGPGHAGIFRKTASSGNLPTLLVENNSTSSNVFGVHSIITSTDPGSFSAAVRGVNKGTDGFGVGVWGSHDGNGWGVYGSSVSGFGVYGLSTSGFAGRFDGDVLVLGTLSKSGGSFKIDHPQDPANMTLSHSFVESPDMKNIYDGVVVLNNRGQAIVTLPSYFNALNQDFRYQLTCIGGFAPVYIAAELESSINAQQFAIAGGTPGLKVSWQVTGIRHDAWANKNRIPTEEYKSPAEQGRYLNPESFNQPKEMGIGYIQSEN